jgi:hypothetical protein
VSSAITSPSSMTGGLPLLNPDSEAKCPETTADSVQAQC